MPDELSYTERWLVGELFKLSHQVSNFAVRTMRVDVENVGLPSIEEEWQLGMRMAELGAVLSARAQERHHGATGHQEPTPPNSEVSSPHTGQMISSIMTRVTQGMEDHYTFGDLEITVGTVEADVIVSIRVDQKVSVAFQMGVVDARSFAVAIDMAASRADER